MKSETMLLHPFEKMLIEYVRQIGHGTVTIMVKDKLPMEVLEAKKKVRFN